MNKTSEINEEKSFVSRRVFTVKKFAEKNKEQGAWPDTEAAIWALRSKEDQNGFKGVFLTISRRVLIDEKKFWGALDRLQESKNASNR